MNIKKIVGQKGFTLVELAVSIAIFAFMTAFLVAKYGTFNQNILLTNTAYEVALSIRNAQSYGINVRSTPKVSDAYSSDFNTGYFLFFLLADANHYAFEKGFAADGTFPNPATIATYTLKPGLKFTTFMTGTDAAHLTPTPVLILGFVRPDPNIIISSGVTPNLLYTEITIQGSNGDTKKIIVRRTGQISIIN